MALRDRLKDLIRREGPMPVSRYMDLCLNDAADGYYATRPDLGERGDFITAPLVSQIFGEILGLWVVQSWIDLGRPSPFHLVELGPGHGVMMADILRAAGTVPACREAAEVWLVETSAPLRERQAATLNGLADPRWASRLEEVPPDGPIVILANEFLDCLPIDQAARTPEGWRERRVGVDEGGDLVFVAGGPVAPAAAWAGAPLGAVAEWSDALVAAGREVGSMVARQGGAALFIDYGRDTPGHGDTLQALRQHRKESPLAHPGEADLTAHVDFPAFLAAARAAGAVTSEIQSQGAFLTALGAEARAAALAGSRPDRAEAITRQLARLVAPDQMGTLFKVAAVHTP